MAEINFEGKVERFGSTLTAESTNENTYLGTKAASGLAAKGEANVALGEGTLEANKISSSNVAVGFAALRAHLTGIKNVAVGALALEKHVSGEKTVAIGANAMGASTGGTENTVIGTEAAEEVTGGNNVAVGWAALKAAGTGVKNVALGSAAAEKATGNKNVYIGSNAGEEATGDGSVLIGNEVGAKAGAEKLYIHNKSTETPLIKGNFKAGALELQFNTEKMGFFKHAPEEAPKLTGNKVTEISVVLKTICEALAKLGLAKDETT